MQSVTLIPTYFIQKYYLTMSNEKSFSEFIDNRPIIPLTKGKLSYTKELLFTISYCFRFLFDLPKNSR